MISIMQKRWLDDEGALIATEFLFISVILVTGLVVGLVNLRNAVLVKFSLLTEVFVIVDIRYQIPAVQGVTTLGGSPPYASVNGSTVTDMLPGTGLSGMYPYSTAPQNPANTTAIPQFFDGTFSH